VLTKLYIDGFRLWADATFVFQHGTPTVLIGPNGSGKTTVLEVMAFLSLAASDGLRAAVYDARGGPAEFFRAGKNRLHLEAWLDSREGLVTEKDGGPIRYELVLLREGPFVRVEREAISIYKRGIDHDPISIAERNQRQCRLANVSTKRWDTLAAEDDQVADLRADSPRPRLPHTAPCPRGSVSAESLSGFLYAASLGPGCTRAG